MIYLIYAGQRDIGKNKLGHAYYQIDLQTTGIGKEWVFKKPLIPSAIGKIISCEPTETGVKGPYSFVAISQQMWRDHKMDDLINSYSVKERADIELIKEQKLGSVEYDSHVDSQINELVKSIRNHSFSSYERRRLAMYVYTKIIGGI